MDEKRIITGDMQGNLKIFDVRDGNLFKEIGCLNESIRIIKFHQAQIICLTDSGLIAIWTYLDILSHTSNAPYISKRIGNYFNDNRYSDIDLNNLDSEDPYMSLNYDIGFINNTPVFIKHDEYNGVQIIDITTETYIDKINSDYADDLIVQLSNDGKYLYLNNKIWHIDSKEYITDFIYGYCDDYNFKDDSPAERRDFILSEDRQVVIQGLPFSDISNNRQFYYIRVFNKNLDSVLWEHKEFDWTEPWIDYTSDLGEFVVSFKFKTIDMVKMHLYAYTFATITLDGDIKIFDLNELKRINTIKADTFTTDEFGRRVH